MSAYKQDEEFREFLLKNAKLDEEGGVKFDSGYASKGVNIMWGGTVVSMPYTHIVWFLTHGRWPKKGYVIDHINDDPMDNRPVNLQELTHKEYQAKRRGRLVYRNYGTGKYGCGLNILHDKRDNRFYVRRYLSRGFGDGDLKTIKRGLGGFDTLAEAESKVKEYVAEIKAKGLQHLPDYVTTRGKRMTLELDASTEKMRELRLQGFTIAQVAQMTGFPDGSVYKRIRDLGIDNRLLVGKKRRQRPKLLK